MPEVEVKKGEPIDRALKRLKMKMEAEGLMDEMRRRRAFETPIEKDKRKARSAPRRNKIRWRYAEDRSIVKVAPEAAE
jgi:small subunit ribosomal protein S21